MDLKPLQERLRNTVRASGKAEREICRQAGLSLSALNDIVNGRSANPGVVTLDRIARVLGVDPAWLAYGVDRR